VRERISEETLSPKVIQGLYEKKEHQLFGEDGFEKMVDQVAGLEKGLGIYDLSQFTPKT